MKKNTLILVAIGLLLAGTELVAQAKDFEPLVEAVVNKDFAGFKRLMNGTFKVTDLNQQRHTPLQWLSGVAPVEYIKYLVSIGADPLAPVKGPDDKTAWDYALVGDTPLEIAAEGGNIETLKYYRSLGAEVSLRALIHAAAKARLATLQFMLPYLPASLQTGKNMASILSVCASYDDQEHVAVSKWLLEQGADPSLAGEEGYSCVHFLAEGKQLAIFKLLLERKVNWNLKNQWNATPIFMAAQHSVNITRELLKRGVDMDGIESYTNLTVLQTAVAAGNPYTTQLLISAGADPNFRNPHLGNKSALDLAAEKGFAYLIPILKKQQTIPMPSWTLDDEIETGLVARFSNLGDQTLTDLQGTKSKVSDLRGKVLILNVWATWCPPCVYEMPSLQKLENSYGSKGVKVLGLSIDQSVSAAQSFVTANKIDFSIYHDDQSFVAYESTYHAQQYPTTYILDARGLTVARAVGSRDWNSPRIKRFLDMILASQGSPSSNSVSISGPSPVPGTEPTHPMGSEIDSVYNYQNKTLFFFRGRNYLAWDLGSLKLSFNTPRLASELWPGLDFMKIDAVIDQGEDQVLIFSDEMYLSYDLKKKQVIGTKATLRSWKNMPFVRIEAGYNNGNGKAYLIKGNEYIRLSTKDWSVDPGYPKALSLFQGLPWARVDDVFKTGQTLYFFLDGQYLLYDLSNNLVMPGFPQDRDRAFPGIDFSL